MAVDFAQNALEQLVREIQKTCHLQYGVRVDEVESRTRKSGIFVPHRCISCVPSLHVVTAAREGTTLMVLMFSLTRGCRYRLSGHRV